MAFPWMAAAVGIPSLLQMLFGGDDQLSQEQFTDTTTTTEQDYPGWRDPMMGVLSPTIMRALLGNLGRYQGAGMPGGQGLGMDNWLQQLMQMLEGEWPKILEGYNKPEGNPDFVPDPERREDRVDKRRLEDPDRRR